eukprot:2430060-Rhodomonas_salina.9
MRERRRLWWERERTGAADTGTHAGLSTHIHAQAQTHQHTGTDTGTGTDAERERDGHAETETHGRSSPLIPCSLVMTSTFGPLLAAPSPARIYTTSHPHMPAPAVSHRVKSCERIGSSIERR